MKTAPVVKFDPASGSKLVRSEENALSERSPDRSFAEEVYASCATIGFFNESVRSLKAALDKKGEMRGEDLLNLALRAQAEAARWAAK